MASGSVLYLVGSILLALQVIFERYQYDSVEWCFFLLYFRWTYPLTMNFHVCLLCFDRYYAIFYPYRYRIRGTFTTAVIAVVIAWILVFIPVVPISITLGTECKGNLYLNSGILLSYVFPIEYFIPSVIILLTYGRALYISAYHTRRIHLQQHDDEISGSKRKTLKKNRKCIIQVVLTFGTYLILYYPIAIMKTIQIIDKRSYKALVASGIPKIFFPLSYFYGIIHPIIFMYYNQSVRTKVLPSLNCKLFQISILKSASTAVGGETTKPASKNINLFSSQQKVYIKE
ncbi:D(5)-like dopamine receptor [Trichoplax sp. H2]|nr:D(5)-like dopamine receptor [Trichoplax sp. H2]|eukprot:RDD46851.1 D(5)-like dopamine receptor [Trichoplax sp. H2]